jgi:hypothetical protein
MDILGHELSPRAILEEQAWSWGKKYILKWKRISTTQQALHIRILKSSISVYFENNIRIISKFLEKKMAFYLTGGTG